MVIDKVDGKSVRRVSLLGYKRSLEGIGGCWWRVVGWLRVWGIEEYW